MKRYVGITLTVLLIISSLTSCGQSTEKQWQEQYDLGVRYLSEGNYEEAIIAFTAAIEIDPKQAPAYVGRGDAYFGIAESESVEDRLADESIAAYGDAEADYLQAVELDSLLPSVYGKLADIYLKLGNADKAISILQRGVDATGSEDLRDKLEKLKTREPTQTEESGYGNCWESALYSWDSCQSYRDGVLNYTYVATAYNEQGFPIVGEISLPDSEEKMLLQITWNDKGQVTQVIVDGEVTNDSYDGDGRIYYPGVNSDYDEYGRIIAVYWDSPTQYITYDERGRISRIDERYSGAGGNYSRCILCFYND